MTTLLHETWETGPNGAACSAANTSWNTLVQHWTFDNTHVRSGQGLLSGKLSPTAAIGQARATVTASDRGYAEIWVWAASLPPADLSISSFRTSSANLGDLRLGVDGSLSIRDTTFTRIATTGPSTFVLSAWNKIQWYYDNAAAQQRLRVFTTTPGGNTPDYDSGLVATTAGGQIGVFQIGALNSTTWTAWFGDVDLNDTAFLTSGGGGSGGTVTARTFASAQASDTGHTIAVGIPGSVAVGDCMVLQFIAGQATNQTTPTGWTKLSISQSTTGLAFDAWQKTATSGDVGATVTVTSDNTASFSRHLHLDVFIGGKVGDQASSLALTSATAHSSPGVTAVDPQAWVLNGCADRGSPSSASWTVPSNLIQRTLQLQTTGGAVVSSITATDDVVGSGSVGSNTFTGTLATAKAVTWSVVIEPITAVSPLTVNAGPDVFVEPWRPFTITPTASGTVDSWTWQQLSPPAPDIVTGSTVDANGTIHLTPPPATGLAQFTIQAIGHRTGVSPNPTDSVIVTVYPATRWFVTATGALVPIRYRVVT